jgi:hypothetical protein
MRLTHEPGKDKGMRLSILVSLLLVAFAVHLGLPRGHSAMTTITAAEDDGSYDPCSGDPLSDLCSRVRIPIG